MHVIRNCVTTPAVAIAMLAILSAPARSQNERSPGGPPPATVRLIAPMKVKSATPVPTLTPSSFSDTLGPGTCAVEHKTLFLPANASPAKLDVVICMDLTGSMGGELNNVKNNSINIANELLGLVPDTQFGVMSHMDYPAAYSGCGYSGTYGSSGDYPYALNQPVTSSIAAFSTAISNLNLGFGNDGPEDYARPLYESYADPAVGWRPGAARVLISWGDDVPHDCAYDAILGGSTTSGPDPGRDGIANNADDLAILNVLNNMAANNVILVSLHSGVDQSLWKAYAALTGGDAFQINPDGTIPGGTPIADFITSKVKEQFTHVDTLKLASCEAAFANWVSVTPAYYTDITLDKDQSFTFDVNICVPDRTPDGTDCFHVCALGDNAEFAAESVCVVVQTNRVPDCSHAVASTPVLWPPNHDFRAISVNGVTDPDGDPVAITVTGITQDEPINTRGDGNTCPDAQIVDGQASVRAERTGTPSVPGNGRVYAIHFTASDGRGGECTGVVTVCCPHDQATACIDDGQKYDSLERCSGRSQVVQEVALSVGQATGGQASLEFALPHDAEVDLGVFDVAGRRLASIEHGVLAAGVYDRTWDMSAVAKGLYFIRLRAGSITVTRTVAKTR